MEEPSRGMIGRIKKTFLLHFLSPVVFRRSLQFSTTLGAGTILLTLLAVTVVTGLLLSFHYIPQDGNAYISVREISYTIPYGWLVRNLHRYASDGMVIIIFLHIIRVFYTASYRGKRVWNWYVGSLLLIFTWSVAFTGFLLKGDHPSFWAGVVGCNILRLFPAAGGLLFNLLTGGGEHPSLIRVFAFHSLLIPSLLIPLILYHLFRIRKDGGLARPCEEGISEKGDGAIPSREVPSPIGDGETLPTWPHLLIRVSILSLLAIFILILLSTLFDSPLGGAPAPDFPRSPERAPWFLLPFQEVASYSSLSGGAIYPLYLISLLILVPLIDSGREGGGVWFGGAAGRGLSITISSLAVTLLLTAAGIVAFELAVRDGPSLSPEGGSIPGSTLHILNPAGLAIAVSLLLFIFFLKWSGSVRGGLIALFTSAVSSHLLFLLAGAIRVEGWRLPFM